MMVRMLLKHGANVVIEDSTGIPPDFAVYGDADIPIVQQLLAQGADPNHSNKRGETPFALSQQKHRSDLVALLEKAQSSKRVAAEVGGCRGQW